jgi:hypothetical protein
VDEGIAADKDAQTAAACDQLDQLDQACDRENQLEQADRVVVKRVSASVFRKPVMYSDKIAAVPGI